MDALCYDMKTLQEVIPIGRNNLYNLVHSEGFPRISVGKRIIIPKKALEDWLGPIADEIASAADLDDDIPF